MKELDYLSLLKMIRICTEKPKYSVGVFTKDVPTCKSHFNMALDAINSDPEEKAALEYSTVVAPYNPKFSIQFVNGSFISFLPAFSHVRGYRFNETLVHQKEEMSATTLNAIRRTEFPYTEGQSCRE